MRLTANPNAAANLATIGAGTTRRDPDQRRKTSQLSEHRREQRCQHYRHAAIGPHAIHDCSSSRRRRIAPKSQGVSLDTESVNLIQYQQAFQASAEVISVINQMMTDAENMLTVTA